MSEEAEYKRAREAILQGARNNPHHFPGFFAPDTRIFLKDELRSTEKGLSELHGIATYSTIAGAVAIAACGVMPPLALVPLPIATFAAKWLWKKGKEDANK
jgi:hypothetical protein